MIKRDYFKFYAAWYDAIKDMPKDLQAEILCAIMEYGINGVETANMKPITKAVFSMVKTTIDRNNKQYLNACKGGAPKGNSNARKSKGCESENNPNSTQKQPKTTQKQPQNNPIIEEKEIEKEKESTPHTPLIGKEKDKEKESLFGEMDGDKSPTNEQEVVLNEEGELITTKIIEPKNVLVCTIEERRQKFIEALKPFVEKYGRDMLNEFYSYWTEANPNGKKMRFEMEKVFDISRRLATWNSRQKHYKPKQQEVNDHVYE